ncbi:MULTISPECIES: cyclase [Micromonospora]|uniref:Cyclase n=1 Tax=Micromonospora solifontis TaxID=2487138 RepID=A0ABX9WHR2_9ACTN|nr:MULTISPECIES: cyclase [Micromonospora]NES12435.1 cyclase [Micromonospora sp. PPF5-17B]NES36351.1 cyclase [Micromonospora solifontis]NES57803.1 cyclase [Micromonospora sp. PPF5-6]RNL99592.1 cyclase [Micromonospora solifontis]
MTSNGARWALAGAATVTAVGVGRAVARRRRRHQPEREDGWYVVHRGITVDRPVDAVIGFWTDRERLDRGLAEWATLEQVDDNRWRCVASDPVGGGTEWRAEITVDGPRRLSWRVTAGPVAQRGRVELLPAPQDRGTEIRAELRWRSGPVRRMLGLAGGHEPDLALRSALRRIKSLLETGQVLDTRHDPSGRDPKQEQATDRIREQLMVGGRP